MNVIKNVERQERKHDEKISKSISDKYKKYFSKKRYRALRVWEAVKYLFFHFLGISLGCSVLVTISVFLFFVEKRSNTDFLLSISNTLLGISISVNVGIVIAIFILLRNNNEYFNQQESKLFFEIRVLRVFNNAIIAIESSLYAIMGIIYLLFKDYLGSTLFSLFSCLLSLLLLIRFIIYSRKNKYEKFYYYLTHSLKYNRKNKKDSMGDYIFVLSIIDNDGNYDRDELNRRIDVRISYINSFIFEMNEKIGHEESVVFEQNILESFFINYSKKINSPIQIISLWSSLNYYLSCIKSSLRNLLKSIGNTKDNIMKVLTNVFTYNLFEFENISLKISDFSFKFMLGSEFNYIYNDFKSIIFVQKFNIYFYRQLVNILSDYGSFLAIDNDVIKKFDIIDGFEKNVEDSLNSISELTQKTIAKITETKDFLAIIKDEL